MVNIIIGLSNTGITNYGIINYSSFDVFIRTEAIFLCLEQEWNKNKRKIKELKWIYSQINYDNKMVDPNLFLDDSAAYIVHVKKLFLFSTNKFLK